MPTREELLGQAIGLIRKAIEAEQPKRSVYAGTREIKVVRVKAEFGYSVALQADDLTIDYSPLLDLSYSDRQKLASALEGLIADLPIANDGAKRTARKKPPEALGFVLSPKHGMEDIFAVLLDDHCGGDVNNCPISECTVCAYLICPGRDPLHFHHDGCPSCTGSGR